ncbi:MAG: EAL domain-containing protein [Desulfuromonadales bacterium]|nr:EAL domain-containing protein [Desulfuromonadales bacterium]
MNDFMQGESSSPLGWVDMQSNKVKSTLLERHERFLLLAKARWFFLGLVAIYGAGAAAGYLLSDYGWFLTTSQLVGLLVGLFVILTYNAIYYFNHKRLAQQAWGSHLQVMLDYLCVTLLIHLSGGAASWFWPVYILVTFEAAILIENRSQVYLLGMFAGSCYGFVLVGEYLNILPNIAMPFIDQGLHSHGFFLVLMWFWVSLLNTISAVVSNYLMTVLRRGHAQVQATEARLKEFLEGANDLIFSVKPDGQFLYANRAWERVLGYDRNELSGLSLLDVIDADMRVKCMAEIEKATKGEKIDPLEGRLMTRSGDAIDVEGTITCSFQNDEAGAVWVICRDISTRKKAQEQLYFMAHHDQLTSLPNRLFFADRLRQAQALAKREKHKCGILYLDLDRFKIINDTLGHAVGDILLQEVGKRLRSCVREVDTVARIGGDEFSIVLVNLDHIVDAEQVAGKILKALAKPVQADENELYITTSIGISIYPMHDDDPDSLLKKADAAMYQAKAQGRNNYQLYDASMDLDAERRMTLESGMRRAIEREEFHLLYQPKINSESNKITALEALIRWEHPELGTLPPSEFIALAEETGLILPIGEWVMRRACMDNRQWQDQGLSKVRVAVNLSGFQLQSKNFVATVKDILEETGLSGEYLEFEIAETVIMQNPEFAVSVLTQLRDLGIHISIDDFGTGYSSLAHLKRFSVNTLKIDRTFVRDIELNPTDAAITSAIISMGNSLNLKVIAEGVETEGQFEMLKEKHCDEMQGYLFSRPVPVSAVEGLLRDGLAKRAGEKDEDKES